METSPHTGPWAATSGPISAGERVVVADVLRGFALFGILVVNMTAFKSPIFGDPGTPDGPLDEAASWIIAAFFQTKFYVLFSFLFGYGLSVQMARAAARGVPLVPRFLRRLLGLFLIGVAHALLLYVGDILVTYALLGVILLLMRNVGDRVLLAVAVGLVTLTALLLALGGAVVAVLPPEALGDASSGAALREEGERAAEGYRGSPAEVISQRASEYPATLAFVLFGQGPTALAMFLLGLWAGRRRLFEKAAEYRALLRRVLVLGLFFGLGGGIVWATTQAAVGFDLTAGFLFAGAVSFATAPLLSGAYAAAIVLLHGRPAWRRRLDVLAPVGRLALTNYLLQSLVGAFIFTGYGLGLFGGLGAAGGLALSVAIFAGQIPLSAWWLRRFDFGPAEWLLRSFTYRRIQPIRSRNPNEPGD
jgi:uncharacterized protein